MTQMIDIKVKDQFSQVYEAQALVRNPSEEDSRGLFHRIEHIIIAGESHPTPVWNYFLKVKNRTVFTSF